MVVKKIIAKFSELGLSESEAKAYIALVKENPLTPYEVAKSSTVATSKVYEVLAKLVEKGMVSEVYEKQKKKFIPLDSNEFIDSYKNKICNVLDDLKDELGSIKKEQDLSYIWNINDYDYLIDKACRMISEAKETLLISIWKNELECIKPFLEEASNSNVKISIVHFGKTDYEIGQVFPHPIEDTLYSEKGGRGFTIISDTQEVLIGTIYENGKVEGASSMNHGFVTMAEDYLKHDIYMMKIVKRFDDLLVKTYGEGYQKLRDIFSDEVLK